MYENWPEVVRNLSWARAVWKRTTRILSREGSEPWVSEFYFFTGDVALWIIDLGDHPMHGKGPGGVPRPGGETSDGAAPAEKI